MRPYYDSLAWIQEAYLKFNAGPATLKFGKIYKKVGIPWDRTFYGNIQVYEGLKFDPNVGASLEGTLGEKSGVGFSAQYFYVDGHLNASLVGRDVGSFPGLRRRNGVTVRIEPFFQLRREARLEFGASAETFSVNLNVDAPQVVRVEGDVTLGVGPWSFWGEVLQQWGAHVPKESSGVSSPSLGSASNTYLLVGSEFRWGPLTPRYNLSLVDYSDAQVREVLHLPGVGVALHPHVTFFCEYAIWDRVVRGVRGVYDQSVNLTLQGHF
jgi:hypothetical protein